MKSMIGSSIHRAEETERRMEWGFEDGFLKRADKKKTIKRDRVGYTCAAMRKGGGRGRLGRYRQKANNRRGRHCPEEEEEEEGKTC